MHEKRVYYYLSFNETAKIVLIIAKLLWYLNLHICIQQQRLLGPFCLAKTLSQVYSSLRFAVLCFNHFDYKQGTNPMA